jgi:transcriptional regulator with XRE-family HTH domain
MMDAAGKSYADLGRALGIERQAVGHWFRDRGEPNVHQMKMMAAEMKCHWLEIVDEEATVVFLKAELERLERMRSLSPTSLAKLDAYLELESPIPPQV